jgi:uncharacterized membrane protein YbhN (UPF0104 family)
MHSGSGHGSHARWRRALRHLAPWVVAGAIVAYVFSGVDLARIETAFAEADLASFLGILAVAALATWALDALTIDAALRRLLGPMTLRECLTLRGLSYLFNALSYSLTAPAMAYYVKKRRGYSFLEGLSTFLWLNFVDILALVALMTVGWAVAGDLLPADLGAQVPWFAGAGWALILGALLFWNGGIDFWPLGRLRGWRIFAAFRKATLAQYVELGLLRALLILAYAVMTWLVLPTFGIEVPLEALLVYVPILTFVQVVPASVSGLGAVQVVMVLLYTPHVAVPGGDPEAHVVAFSTAMGPTMTVIRLVIALLLVAFVPRDVFPHKGDLEAAREAEEEPLPPQGLGDRVSVGSAPPET